MTDVAVDAQQPARSWWEDLVDIFLAPAAVFERRRNGRFGLALLLITVLFTLLYFAWSQALGPAVDAEAARAMARRGGELTAEQVSQGLRIGRIAGVIGFGIVFPIGVMLTGVVLWAVGKAFAAALTIGTAIAIVTYAQLVRILQFWLGMLQRVVVDVYAMDSIYDTTFSPARFLDVDAVSPVVMVLASRFDVFTIWATVLIAVGLQAAANVPRAKAWAAAAIVFVLAAIPQALGGLAGAMGGG